ncbi:MAG TPA: DUF6569 family protein [Chryseosolibacter sp.]|nr:DUF6569 family protein [Chryseosolibacter sp.]
MKLLCALFILLAVPVAHAQYTKDNLRTEPVAENSHGFRNLRLYPVRANHTFLNHHKSVKGYKSLEESLRENKIAITEVSSGEVNKLYVENVSSDTVIILAGEVVEGGKQNRVLAKDMIIPPLSGKNDVDVFCVEEGRWSPRKGDMAFKGYYTISSNEVRKAAAVKKDQRAVWNKVAETTEKNNARSSTSTLTELKNSSGFSGELEKYIAHFSAFFVNEPDVIGVIAVTGDSVMGCDLFATHELFAKTYRNLLNSYATEAITSGRPVTASYEEVSNYLDAIISDESQQQQRLEKNGTILKQGARTIHISSF